jgi:hypothetical protein
MMYNLPVTEPMRVSKLDRKRAAVAAFFLLAASLPFALGRPSNRHPAQEPPAVRFERATEAWGLARSNETFSAAVADIDNDGRDDLLVSNHNDPPSLFLNKGDRFVDASELLPDPSVSDWHGIAAVDLDNDGDRDIVFAGGGEDGTGPGERNRLFRNMLAETGRFMFRNSTPRVGIAYPPWRTRQFLPLPSPDGSRVDLYMVGLARPDCPNLYLANRSGRDIVLEPEPALGLNEIMGSEGYDLFLDFDRDGDQDLIIIKQFRPELFERRPDGYHRRDDVLPDLGGIYQIAAGDLDNDGYPDLFLASYPPFVHSDNLSWDEGRIQFVIEKQKDDASDEFTFETPATSVEFDFEQHTPGNPITGSEDIRLGPAGAHPDRRVFRLEAAAAEWEPVVRAPGTSVWKEKDLDRWHVRWQYGLNAGPYKGSIRAVSIGKVETIGFETQPPAQTEDFILINQNGKGFKKLDAVDLRHSERTRSSLMVDLNNDGWLDIVGLRGTEQGRPNGTPFVLVNRGGLKFEFETVMDSPADRLFQADQIVYGFFNDDGLADIFFTNGNGLKPGNQGPFELYLNATPPGNDYVILKLQGTKANRDAIGAEVELLSADGARLGYRQVGMGFNRDQSSIKVHFGLGKSAAEKLKVRILWPAATAWDEREVEKNRINEIIQ